jgi:hypothetical protein
MKADLQECPIVFDGTALTFSHHSSYVLSGIINVFAVGFNRLSEPPVSHHHIGRERNSSKL